MQWDGWEPCTQKYLSLPRRKCFEKLVKSKRFAPKYYGVVNFRVSFVACVCWQPSPKCKEGTVERGCVYALRTCNLAQKLWPGSGHSKKCPRNLKRTFQCCMLVLCP